MNTHADKHTILHLAADTGRLILENGGETHRVEETMNALCRSFGYGDSESFVTPTGIFLSVSDDDGRTRSIIRRIKHRSINLNKVLLAGRLAESVCSDRLSPVEMRRELIRIENEPGYAAWLTVPAAALTAGFFTLLFGGGAGEFGVALYTGGTIKALSLLLSSIRLNEFFINVAGGALAALLALVSAAMIPGIQANSIIIGSIMLLVPGLAITNSIRDTLAGDLLSGLARAMESFLIAVAIAAGSGIVLKLWYLLAGGIR